MGILGHRREDDWERITILEDRANQWNSGGDPSMLYREIARRNGHSQGYGG